MKDFFGALIDICLWILLIPYGIVFFVVSLIKNLMYAIKEELKND